MSLMTGTTIGLWVVFNVAGFGLLYTPFIHNPAAFAVRDQQEQWALVDGVYLSAVTFFTIGYGDIVPVHPLTRLLAIAEGAFGLLTISLSVTYLLSVYPVITRKIAFAAALNQETGGRADGVVFARRYLAGRRGEALGERLRWLNDELLYLGQAHGFYPLLYYARPRNVHESFVRILALTQGIVATLRYGLDAEQHQEVVDDPRLAILEEGLLYTLHSLEHSSHLSVAAPAGGRRADGSAAARLLDLRALGRALAGAGLTPAAAGGVTGAAYERFVAATTPYIAAYAANAAYSAAGVWATYSRWARDADLESNDDESVDASQVASGALHAEAERRV
jgi:hypothetical protein